MANGPPVIYQCPRAQGRGFKVLRVFCFSMQLSNISSDLRYKNNHKANRSIGQSTLTKRSSYFHIRWLRHFPKVKHYPLSGLVGKESTHGNAVHNQSQARCLPVMHGACPYLAPPISAEPTLPATLARTGLLMRKFRITHRGLLD